MTTATAEVSAAAKICDDSGRYIQQSTNSGSRKNVRNGNGNGSGKATMMTTPTVAVLAATKISNDNNNVGINDNGDSGRRQLLRWRRRHQK